MVALSAGTAVTYDHGRMELVAPEAHQNLGFLKGDGTDEYGLIGSTPETDYLFGVTLRVIYDLGGCLYDFYWDKPIEWVHPAWARQPWNVVKHFGALSFG